MGISTLIAEKLETMIEGGDRALDLALVESYINIFAVCVRVRNPITQGLGLLTTTSARYTCHMFYRLAVAYPTSSVLEDMRRRYHEVLPDGSDFTGLPFRHSLVMIDSLIRRNWRPRPVWRDDDRPLDREHIQFARNMADLAQEEHKQERMVPKWILDFAFDSLTLDPLPPTPVVVDCLKVVAIDLGCDILQVTAPDERYTYSNLRSIHLLTESSGEAISSLITQALKTIGSGDRAPGSTTVVHCFNIFAICIRVSRGRVVIKQGLEQLATSSADCTYRTFHRLTVTDPTSDVLEAMCQSYHAVLPDRVDFTGLQCRHTMTMVDALIRRDWGLRPIWHKDNRLSNQDHIQFAQDITDLAQVEYQQKQEVPKWILDFAFCSLSLVPLPPTSVIVDCLKVVAIDLGCDVLNSIASDDRYIYLDYLSLPSDQGLV